MFLALYLVFEYVRWPFFHKVAMTFNDGAPICCLLSYHIHGFSASSGWHGTWHRYEHSPRWLQVGLNCHGAGHPLKWHVIPVCGCYFYVWQFQALTVDEPEIIWL